MTGIVFIISFFLSVVPVVYGHEGHNKTPGALAAQHGGQVKQGKDLIIEATYESGMIKLFTYNHEMEKVAPETLKVIATVKKMPKPGTTSPLDLKEGDGFFEAKMDAKGARRLEVAVEISSGKSSDKLTFNIEI